MAAERGEIKSAMRTFYASETAERDTEEWLAEGGSARVPESRTSHYFVDRKIAEAVALTRLDPKSRVIEVGSSFGHMSFPLAQRFREVVAVDLSAESIDLARRRAARYNVTNVRFEVADAENLGDFTDGEFDGAFAFSTLRFCPNPDVALAEIRRLLKPGGRAAMDVPNRWCPWYGPIKAALRIQPHIHDRLFSIDEFRRLIEKAGFRDVRAKHILFTTKRIPDALLPASRLADRVFESLPGVRRLSGIIMAAGTKGASG